VDRARIVSLTLRPLRDDEVPAYIERGRAAYRNDLVTQAGLPDEAADRKAQADWERLLPEPKVPDGAHMYALEDESGARVGVLWWTQRDDEQGPAAYVYEVEIEEAYRGRGHGREAMRLFEEDARAHGFERASLLVLGGNEVARSLYRSLDYAERAVFMSKSL
jgi:ribosomal protein S18 acetylase RimI-like enzyme